MTPNVVNTIIGLLLIYAAILNPSILSGHPPLLITAAVILLMAVWARRGDAHPWQSNVNITMAILLAALSFLPPDLLGIATFWGPFWIGIIVSITALWAAIYRPGREPPRQNTLPTTIRG
jgi:hypothetical protein